MKIFFNGKIKRDNWECYAWSAHIGPETVQYFTGLGHSTKARNYGLKPTALNKKVIRSEDGSCFIHVPKLRDILYSLASDAQLGNETFEDFCSNLGYDTDSRKALESYLECQKAAVKLRTIFKSKNPIERILAWEL